MVGHGSRRRDPEGGGRGGEGITRKRARGIVQETGVVDYREIGSPTRHVIFTWEAFRKKRFRHTVARTKLPRNEARASLVPLDFFHARRRDYSPCCEKRDLWDVYSRGKFRFLESYRRELLP